MIMGLSMFLPMTVGQLSFGQAGFMSIGAHIAVVLTLYAGVWFPLALLLAGIGTGIIGFLVGIPVLRLRGLLLALMTLPSGRWWRSFPQFQADWRCRGY